MPSKIASRKRKKPLVFIPKKPWDPVEREKMITIPGGKGKIQASLFEHLVSNKRDMAEMHVLFELNEHKRISPTVKRFVDNFAEGKKTFLTERALAGLVDDITKCMDRRTMSDALFGLLEDLRLDLANRLEKERRH